MGSRLNLDVMAFHFHPSEPPARAIRRVCHERIQAARQWLRQGSRPKVIHEVRKEIKRVRAVLHLLDDGKNGKNYRRMKKNLRSVARRLADARDARVMWRSFEKLTAHKPGPYMAIAAQLRSQGRRETRRFKESEAVGEAKRKLRKCNARVDNLDIPGAGWMTVAPGVRRVYWRGRLAWRKADRNPSPEAFHDWRKQVKVLGYHLELLGPDWPPPIRRWQHQLEWLGEVLGEDHDLALLRQFVLDGADAFPRPARALNRLIAAREKKLRTTAMKLGVSLYAETPAVFCRQLGTAWNAWRKSEK